MFAFVLGLYLLLPLAASAQVKIPEVRHALKSLNLSRPPATEEIMAAGQLGGQLYPTHEIQDHNRELQINHSFGTAIELWNRHEYKKAVQLFKKHVADYPDSQWASEAVLHCGCDAQYNGRYTEAEQSFNWILEKNSNKDHEGAIRLTNKARLRLGVLKVYQNNFSAAQELFRDLKKDDLDWRNRTYAAHWLQRLSRYSKNELAMLNCGTQALAYLLEKDGKAAKARSVLELLPETTRGHSIKSLSEIASQYGYNLAAVKVAPSDLQSLPKPAIMHISGKNPKDSGHYWILDKMDNDTLELFDPQAGRRFQQSMDEFSQEWSGNALVFSGAGQLPGRKLSKKEQGDSFGGCCGVPRPEEDLGDPDDDEDDSCSKGSPAWKVNKINMNLFVTDTPIWYKPPIGPEVKIRISYNSQSAIAYHQPFGNKWQFNYGSFLVVDTGGVVTIFMPDGRRDVYSPNGSGGYSRPYKVYNTLTKITGNHFELKFPDDTVYVYNIPAGTASLQPFLVEIRDAHGQKLTFSYNSDVLLTGITDAMGRVTTLTYSASGFATQVMDPFGRTAHFEYDAQHNLTKITDMGGYWTSFSYDSDIYVSGMENERGRWAFYVEPADGITNGSNDYPAPGGIMWQDYRITATNPLGGKAEYHYDGNAVHGWYVSPKYYINYVSQANNNYSSDVPKMKYYYQSNHIREIDYPEGGHTDYGYDAAGNRTSIADSHGHTIQYGYNAMGNVTSITDAKGNATQNTYAPNGVDLLQITNGLGTTTVAYTGSHAVASVTDRLNNQTTFTYNSYGQIESQTDALGIITNYVYDNTRHQLQQVIRAGKTISSYTYDSIGRTRTSTDSSGLTLTYDYDNLNRVTKTTYPDGKFESKVYASCCPRLLDSVTDRSGRTMSYFYDTLGRLIRTVNPEGGATEYEYDANGNIVTLIDANGNRTAFEFDKEDRLTKKIYADGTQKSFAYDLTGLLISRTNARGTSANSTYDENHNFLGISYSNGAPTVSYQYDAYDRAIQRQDAVGTYVYGYDADNRFTSIDGPWANDTITYQYDAIGRRTGLTPQGGQAITYVYDDVNRLVNIHSGTNTYTYTFTGASPLTQSLVLPNGSHADYSYDGLDRLTGTANKKSSAQLINQHVFAYNQQDVRASETITNGVLITSFKNELTAYDYNPVNQLVSTTIPAGTYAYDDDGNLVQGFNPQGFVMYMTYDAENRLNSAQYTDGAAIVHRTEYVYSGDGLLAEKKKYEHAALIEDTRYVRSGFLPVQERDGNNQVTRSYLWGRNMGGGVGGLLNLKQNGLDYSYLYDGKGNVTALIDSSQNVVATYTYDPFGVVMNMTGTFDQPYQFSTKEYDPETGLLYYGYRFYAPVLGRWITRDPIGELGGINLYGFVGNNPVNHEDPFGLYGTNDCSYYMQRCFESGGKYYCETAQYWCNKFPKYPDPDPNRDDDFEGWSRCTRQCLQDCDKDKNKDQNTCPDKPDPTTDEFTDAKNMSCHFECYTKCGAQKMLNPSTP